MKFLKIFGVLVVLSAVFMTAAFISGDSVESVSAQDVIAEEYDGGLFVTDGNCNPVACPWCGADGCDFSLRCC
jgi:uncharacterized protein CbrC (UPF0167 family)